MKRNDECIRAIMLYLEENLSEHTKIKGHNLYDVLPDFSTDDIDESIRIILERKLVSKKNVDHSSPKSTRFERITDKGHDYLAVVRNDTTWNSIKEKFKSFLHPDTILGALNLYLSSNGLK